MDPAEELYARLRASVGRTVEFTAPDELGRPAIRQFALALGDFNPVYTDRDAARAAGLPDVMAPPTFVCETMQYLADRIDDRGDFPALDGAREPGGLRAGNDYELFRPVHPNDVISARWEVKDVYRKDTRSGALIFVVTEITYRNQHRDLLAVNREHMFHGVQGSGDGVQGAGSRGVRSESTAPGSRPSGPGTRPGGASPGGASPGPEQRHRADQIPAPATSNSGPDTLSPVPRTRTFAVGEALPPLVKEITIQGMMAYGAATWDFIRLHYDADHVRALGFPAPFVDGQMFGGILAQAVQNWVGPGALVRRLSFRNRVMTYPGDTMTCRGVVTDKTDRAGERLIACDLWVENQKGERVVHPASAVIRFP